MTIVVARRWRSANGRDMVLDAGCGAAIESVAVEFWRDEFERNKVL